MLLKSGAQPAQIFSGLASPDALKNLPDTPASIRGTAFPEVSNELLHGIAEVIGGKIAPKGIENTIRFVTKGKNEANEETWHSHPQFDFSIFFCLRADPNAHVFMVQARDIYETASGQTKNILLTPYPYLAEAPAFALLERHGERFTFARPLYSPSKLQGDIEDLDLPDVKKTLEHICNQRLENCPAEGLSHFLKCFETGSHKIVYQPGDVAIYDEKGTLRYSPPFEQTEQSPHNRWLQSLSLLME